MTNTENGLATNVRNNAINNATPATSGNRDGYANNPSKKKINICIKPVRPSKKCTSDFFPLKGLLPRIIPAIYVLKYPLPPIADATA